MRRGRGRSICSFGRARPVVQMPPTEAEAAGRIPRLCGREADRGGGLLIYPRVPFSSSLLLPSRLSAGHKPEILADLLPSCLLLMSGRLVRFPFVFEEKRENRATILGTFVTRYSTSSFSEHLLTSVLLQETCYCRNSQDRIKWLPVEKRGMAACRRDE